MNSITIRKYVNNIVTDARLAEVNDMSVLLLFTVLSDENLLDDAIFLEFNDVVSDIRFLVVNIENEKSKRILLDGLGVFEREINDVSNHVLLMIWRRIGELLIISDAQMLFEEFIYQINLLGRNNEALSTSEELNKLIGSLCGEKDELNIYNPFAGFGSLALVQPLNSWYLGEEINNKISVIANLRLLINGRVESGIVKNVDSLDRFANNIDFYTSDGVLDSDYSNEESRKFDLAISIPPFNLKGKDGKNVNAKILKNGVDLLSKDGRLVYVFAASVFSETLFCELLKELCEKDLLEGVISLPVGTFTRIGIKTCIIVINCNKSDKDRVRFVDANQFTNVERRSKDSIKFDDTIDAYFSTSDTTASISVTNSELLAKGSFYPENLIYQILTPEIESSVEFGDLILTERPFSRNLDEQKLNLPRINFSDLNNNIKLDYRNIKVDEVRRNDLFLNDSCFLIGTFNGQLKFSYFKYQHEMHCCSANMIPIKIDEEKVSIPYFAKQLTEPYLQEQIKQLTKGSAIQKVSKSDLLKVRVILLNLKEQERQAENILKFFHEGDRNLQLMASLEDQLFEQTVYLRHSIAGPTRNVLSFMKKMMLIIDGNPNIIAGELGRTKLKPADRYSFKDMREIVERDLIKVENVVKNQLDIQQQIFDSKLEVMDIDAFLSDYIHNLKEVHPQITISYESFVPYLLDDIDKTEYITILGNQELLCTMLDNFFENARQHSFVEGLEKKFLVKLNYDEDSGVLSVEVANSGKGFPKDIGFKGFIAKNKKSHNSTGNGFGGWYIYQVIKHHKGDLEIDDNSIFYAEVADGYATSFHIQLPLAQE